MKELNLLQSSLARIFRDALPVSTSLENPQAIKALQKINQELSGVLSVPASASIAQVVETYRRSQKMTSFHDLKYVCYGTAMPMPDGWCVLGDEKLRDKLLAEVEQLAEPLRRFKYFQALLSSYFAFERYDEKTPETAHAGWEILRDWLAQQKTQFQRDGVNKKIRLPVWFAVLTEHENLLTDKPCDRYGADMLQGDSSSIEGARQGLGIPGESWVMQEAILSQIRAAVAFGDDPFKTRLDPLIRLAQGQTEVTVSPLLKLRAVAILVSRYARCAGKPEQPVLRDAAVSIIGNPWLKRTAWDAWVKKPDGQPDDGAREMVNGWLTRQLITDFFELLSADGRVDQRRLNYWLRFVPAIEGTPWLALGPDAMKNWRQPYRELRERAKGRLLRLENPGASSNNAFIMKMGEWLIVEFGVKGNACYIYPVTPMPFSLGGVVISLNDLKNRNLGDSLRHADGHNSWESNFDQTICPKINYWPDRKFLSQSLNRPTIQQSSTTEPNAPLNMQLIEKFALDWKLTIKDNRGKGGALWIYADDRISSVSHALKAWGFKYKENRGWWKE